MSEVFDSIFSTIPAFAYRCRNDKTYTMEFMQGAVETLTGHQIGDILGNKRVSYVGLTHPNDIEHVFAEVDEAIENRLPWDVAYRLKSQQGRVSHVRERGSAVFENGELVYLQGLVVGAEKENSMQEELRTHLGKSEETNRKILDITEQITRSLKQLNMLSINARIEAARTGPEGLGFAVVADEIKALATQNSQWADVISKVLRAEKA